MSVLLPLLALIAAGAWRFAPASAGWTASALTVLIAVALGWRAPRSARSSLPALAILGAAVIALRLLSNEAIWPCAIHCQGGGHYQELFGLSVLWPALLGLTAFALSCLRDQNRERLSTPTAALGWLLVGASCYYLYVGVRLGIVCPHCLAVHTVVLACAGGLLRTLPAVPAASAAALAFLGLHFAFHPGVVSDTVDVEISADPKQGEPVLSPVNRLAFATADGVRRSGDSSAPVVLELVLDLQCPICDRQHRQLNAALNPSITAKKAELVVRQLVRKSEPASQTLGRWAFAAAIKGRQDYEFFIASMLGSRAGADARELRARLAEAIDPLELEALIDRHKAAIDRLLYQDAQRLIELQAPARTPQLIAVDRASGKPLKRWVGELPIDEIAEWLAK